MKLIIGLGNPGEKYKNNRHNVGYMVIDAFQESKLPKGVTIRKTDCFMNDSGLFVKNILSKYPKLSISDLYIIHDDLDIKQGEYKIQFTKGPKDHNGLLSIENEIGTNKFWRARIGVDNRNQDNRTKGEEYVLQDFNVQEKVVIKEVIESIKRGLLKVVQ
ncbi:peptidyl-tRNA hydrolase [Candidatus Woesebacteria bacterium]|nr:peptidyl-tRNA hydrolase [Candidatus Woesebacteria bacterium]